MLKIPKQRLIIPKDGLDEIILRGIIEISKVSYRWKEYCFSKKDILYIEGLREKLIGILIKSEDKKIALEEIKSLISQNKEKLEIIHKSSVIGDGNLYEHPKSQYRLIREYGIYDSSLSKENLNILLFLALIHDLGELKLGDVLFHKKTTRSISEESSAGIEIIKLLFKDETLRNRALSIYEIDYNDKDPLYPDFKLYEKLGYIKGMIQAYKNEKNIENFLAIANSVIENNLCQLIEICFVEPKDNSKRNLLINFLLLNKDILEEIICLPNEKINCEVSIIWENFKKNTGLVG